MQQEEGKAIILVERNTRKGLAFTDLGLRHGGTAQLAVAGIGADLGHDPEVGRLFLGA